MFIVDVLFLVVICAIHGYVVARDNQMLQIERGAKIKCDGAFQNFVRMKERTRLLTESKVAIGFFLFFPTGQIDSNRL